MPVLDCSHAKADLIIATSITKTRKTDFWSSEAGILGCSGGL